MSSLGRYQQGLKSGLGSYVSAATNPQIKIRLDASKLVFKRGNAILVSFRLLADF